MSIHPVRPPARVIGVVASIHDVTPRWADEVQRLWGMCRAHGITPALLVVPDWHGAWAIEQHEDFLSWLRTCAADGAEIILHGERHDEVGSRRRWRDTLRAVGRTAREGEFLTLDEADAHVRIARGMARLMAVGLQPMGFIPPAWLARRATHAAAAACGLRMSEDVARVYLHRQRRTVATPVLRWSGRSPWRAVVSHGIAWWRWTGRRQTPVLRLAFHPQDLHHPCTAQSVAQAIRLWGAERPALSYTVLEAACT